jgi:Calcineurin-like phosphoesterase
VLADVIDRGFVNRQLGEIRRQLQAGTLDAEAEQAVRGLADAPAQPVGASPAQTLLASLPPADAGPPSSGGEATPTPFLSRDPIVSMVQTALEEQLRAEHPDEIEQTAHGFHPGLVAHEILGAIERLIHPERFGPHDPGWITEIVAAVARRLEKGNHRFTKRPATHEIASDDARIVLVGDWGSGLPRAIALKEWMAQEVAGARDAAREVHVVHLGDVYYSGERSEYDARLIAPWPVSRGDADAGVTSWSLNGNHDMYSGGWAYFDHLLAHPLFAAQRVDRKPTSWFHLTTPSWDIIALDTSWERNPLAAGHTAVLEDPQAQYVTDLAADSRKRLMLLSHHQLISEYDQRDIGRTLPRKLASVLAGPGVDAWFWGHEHRCMGFAPVPGVRLARCLGHGGVPVVAHDEDVAIEPPGIWEERDFLDSRGVHWGRFGFAVLDFAGREVEVRYRNDLGAQVREETIA